MSVKEFQNTNNSSILELFQFTDSIYFLLRNKNILFIPLPYEISSKHIK